MLVLELFLLVSVLISYPQLRMALWLPKAWLLHWLKGHPDLSHSRHHLWNWLWWKNCWSPSSVLFPLLEWWVKQAYLRVQWLQPFEMLIFILATICWAYQPLLYLIGCKDNESLLKEWHKTHDIQYSDSPQILLMHARTESNFRHKKTLFRFIAYL